jgi:hypothetical protein
VKKTRYLFGILLIWGGIIGNIGGCTMHKVSTAPTPQMNEVQQQTSSQKNATQQSAEPVSPEAFNTFLDRG